MSKRPTKIEIMGTTFDVSYVRKVDDQGSDGESNMYERRIAIRQSPDWHDHLLHEILHMILSISGQAESMSGRDEEGLVVALENGLKELVKVNPRSRFIWYKEKAK